MQWKENLSSYNAKNFSSIQEFSLWNSLEEHIASLIQTGVYML